VVVGCGVGVVAAGLREHAAGAALVAGGLQEKSAAAVGGDLAVVGAGGVFADRAVVADLGGLAGVDDDRLGDRRRYREVVVASRDRSAAGELVGEPSLA
jgi:hypothetical protein